MVDVVRLAPVAASPSVDSGRSAAKRAGQHYTGPGFGTVLAHLAHPRLPGAVQPAAARTHAVVSHTRRGERPASVIPDHAAAALQQAMTLEGVPKSWHDSLRFIVAQESEGEVNAKSPIHSARGLFQLTAANYHLNPNGAQSFGNAVEEAQGGIRYIKQRYGTAENAAAFWRQHSWY
jgi:hypothetical protein